MQKPSNYDQEKAANLGEGFETIEPGGYICNIRKAVIETSKKGNEMLVILFDIYEGDKKEFYKRQYDENTQQDKKWKGIYRQVVGGTSTKFFKGVIESIEQSNKNFKFNFDENTLKGKLFGGIFGREEYFNVSKGANQFSTKLLWIRNVETIRSGDFKIPEDKLLPSSGTGVSKTFEAVGFTPISSVDELDDDDFPF